ncbi:GNAT family N-acetyltransferase [Chloroflexota bacterium]
MISGNKVKLREKKNTDARNDYTWQTDPILSQLDAAPQLKMSFTRYRLDYIWELHIASHTRCRFSIDTSEGKHIGNCSYYDINDTKGETELGIMIGDRDYWDRGYGTDAVSTLVDYIFGETSLRRVYLKTLESNLRAQKCFQKCGFTEYGRLVKNGYHFMLMELHRKDWRQRPEQT